MVDTPRLTSRDLARLAGVSQSTVSRVLTDSPRVSPETRAKVLEILEREDYTPNALARAMKTGRTDTVGVFMSRITSPFHSALLDAIGRKLSAAGLHMILWNLEHDTDESATQVIRRRLVDGFIFTSARFDSGPERVAVRAGLPTVLVHRGVDDLACDQVVGDNWRGAWDVGHYLARAGHTRIGLVTSVPVVSTTREREHGFVAGLKKAGVKLPAEFVIRGGFTHRDGHAGVRALLAMKRPPTAVYAITDILALGVLDGARSLGVRVPDDLWVVGFDNIEMASWEAFDLTTVQQDIESIADAGVERLRRRIAEPDAKPTTTRLPCPLVVRGSTAHTPVAETPPPPRRRAR